MDRQTEQAINALWTRGVDAMQKRIDELEQKMDERFAVLENEKRWRITQAVFVLVTLATFVIDILTRNR